MYEHSNIMSSIVLRGRVIVILYLDKGNGEKLVSEILQCESVRDTLVNNLIIVIGYHSRM